jgi:uncharacterized protein (TIGR03437 family)
LVTWEQKPSMLAESFRATLTSILFSGNNGTRPRVLVVTSPSPSEGKSTVISNLAIALAEVNRKVLLIDGDLRKPRLHHIREWRRSRLSDLLKGARRWAMHERVSARRRSRTCYCCRADGIGRGHQPAALGSHGGVPGGVRAEYDMVLIDAPPMMQMPDARILGRMADAVILVIRAGRTTRDTALAATAAGGGWDEGTGDGAELLGPEARRWRWKIRVFTTNTSARISPPRAGGGGGQPQRALRKRRKGQDGRVVLLHGSPLLHQPIPTEPNRLDLPGYRHRRTKKKLIVAATLSVTAGWAQPVLRAIDPVVNGASYADVIAPGSIFGVFGTNLAGDQVVQAPSLPLQTTLGGVSIRLTPVPGANAISALMVYTTKNQIAGLLPSSTAPGDSNVTVTYNGQTSGPGPARVAARSVGIVTADSSGAGQAQAQIFYTASTFALNRYAQGRLGQFDTNPGHAGEAFVLWATGLGADPASDLNGGSSGNQTAANEGHACREMTDLRENDRVPGTDQINFTFPPMRGPARSITGCRRGR